MPKYKPSHLKKMNTKIVFDEFKRNSEECLFVNEIARKSKISVPTVMKIVDFLIEEELLKEDTCIKTSVGRKPNMLKLNTDKYFSIGIIYEGEYLTLGIVDLAGQISNFIQVKCGKNFEDSLFLNIDKLLQLSQRNIDDLIGIGIGLPCIFEKSERKITAPLIGIDEPKYFGNVIDAIEQRYNVKVVVDNDLNIQAFGEYDHIKLESREDLIFISLGTGLGAGIIINGKARKGNHNICGEIGYMMFEYSEEVKNSGWLESKINVRSLDEKFGILQGNISDEKKQQAIEYTSKYMAMLINNLIFCYDVSKIVVDGYVFEILGDELLEQIQKRLDKICYRSINIQKKTSQLPGVSGGAILASNVWLDEIFS